MKKIFLFVLLSCTLFASIKIAVAANMSYAMPKIIEAFKKVYPSIQVKMTIGSSGKLTAQIQRGAPFDLFLSANMLYPKKLYEKGFAYTKPLVYAKGALVLFSKKEISSLQDLAKLHRIAIANPNSAPYGKAALEALKNMHLYKKVRNKLIYGESVAQATAYALSAADAGFIAKSAMYSPKLKALKKRFYPIDLSLYTPIDQGVVILQRGRRDEVLRFFAFLFSKKTQNILQEYGYIVDDN